LSKPYSRLVRAALGVQEEVLEASEFENLLDHAGEAGDGATIWSAEDMLVITVLSCKPITGNWSARDVLVILILACEG
jgi:hypothetical protein